MYNNMDLTKLRLICLCATVAVLTVEAAEISSAVRHEKCRTRFTFSRPTHENDDVISILFGTDKGKFGNGQQPKISFNHDEVGISQPIRSGNPFPSCLGYPKKTNKYLEFHNQLSGINDGDTTTICSSTDHNGWRILRFQKRVGYGKQCYQRVQNAILNWDFEARKGKKSMGILSSTQKTQLPDLDFKLNTNVFSFTNPRRSLLATFTEICLPSPLKSIFVVNPVHVAYEVKDGRYSSTAYATLSGHLLAGEERVTVRKGMGGEVEVEIVSFSRSSSSIGGKIIWPLIGRMQKQFFLSEMDHLYEVGQGTIHAAGPTFLRVMLELCSICLSWA